MSQRRGPVSRFPLSHFASPFPELRRIAPQCPRNEVRDAVGATRHASPQPTQAPSVPISGLPRVIIVKLRRRLVEDANPPLTEDEWH